MYASSIQFHYIGNDMWPKQTERIGTNVKIKCCTAVSIVFNLNHYNNKQICKKEKQKGI